MEEVNQCRCNLACFATRLVWSELIAILPHGLCNRDKLGLWQARMFSRRVGDVKFTAVMDGEQRSSHPQHSCRVLLHLPGPSKRAPLSIESQVWPAADRREDRKRGCECEFVDMRGFICKILDCHFGYFVIVREHSMLKELFAHIHI
jgi:hypothetical protein